MIEEKEDWCGSLTYRGWYYKDYFVYVAMERGKLDEAADGEAEGEVKIKQVAA